MRADAIPAIRFAPVRLWTTAVPAFSSMAATSVAVVVLPFVPVTSAQPEESPATISLTKRGYNLRATRPGKVVPPPALARRLAKPRPLPVSSAALAPVRIRRVYQNRSRVPPGQPALYSNRKHICVFLPCRAARCEVTSFGRGRTRSRFRARLPWKRSARRNSYRLHKGSPGRSQETGSWTACIKITRDIICGPGKR